MYCIYKIIIIIICILLSKLILYCIILMKSSISTLVDLWNAD